MPRGPAPAKNKRRRNAPTIPTTELPVGGRKGRPPKPPAAYSLGKAGAEWWKWAWSSPQAMAWDPGSRYVVARRASLEDDLDAIDNFPKLNLAALFDLEEESPAADVADRVEYVLRRTKSLAGGRLGILKEMRELDKVLGLNPKAMLDLRWEIVDEKEGEEAPKAASAKKGKPKPPADSRRARLELVKTG